MGQEQSSWYHHYIADDGSDTLGHEIREMAGCQGKVGKAYKRGSFQFDLYGSQQVEATSSVAYQASIRYNVSLGGSGYRRVPTDQAFCRLVPGNDMNNIDGFRVTTHNALVPELLLDIEFLGAGNNGALFEVGHCAGVVGTGCWLAKNLTGRRPLVLVAVPTVV